MVKGQAYKPNRKVRFFHVGAAWAGLEQIAKRFEELVGIVFVQERVQVELHRLSVFFVSPVATAPAASVGQSSACETRITFSPLTNLCKHTAATHYIFGRAPRRQLIPNAIHPLTIEMALLKRVGEAAFVPAPGLELQSRIAYCAISVRAVEVAYRKSEKG